MIAAILQSVFGAKKRVLGLAGLAVLLGTVGACAQVLPRNYDPNLREAAQNPPVLPALRFLTVADYPPFNYRDASGALVGFNVDLAQAICDDLNTNCTMQAWPWDQAADALTDNQGDALIGGLALTSETAEIFDFSTTYLRFPARFVVANEDLPTFTPDNLSGQRIAVRAGSRHEDLIRRFSPGALIVEADTEFDALDLVGLGRADSYFGDALRASFWLGQGQSCCSFAGEAYFRPDYFGEGLSVAVNQNREEVTAAIDFALARLARSGKMDELYLRWFPIGYY